jgi:hypothetical protein
VELLAKPGTCATSAVPSLSFATTSPTKKPTGIWNISYRNMTANFTASSSHELMFEYDISATRDYEVEALLKKDCVSSITDIEISLVDEERASKESGTDTLTLWYDVDKTAIASSSIWNSSSNTLELCQIVRLVDNGMTIFEDKHIATINFDLTADFSFDNTLTNAAAGTDNAPATNVGDYVEACKCTEAFECNSLPLQQNQELHLCVYSSANEVGIASITSTVRSCTTDCSG